MSINAIDRISTYDARYPLEHGAGSDAAHTNPEYCLAVTQLKSTEGVRGAGFALTLGEGNRLVCEAIQLLARPLQGRLIEDLMAEFGRVSRQPADDPMLRWLGAHKGVVHLALARKFNLPVVPHVGDMGQVHQHLVIFNHIAMGHEALFLEHIPHLRPHFVSPAKVEGGYHRTPEDPGASSDLKVLVDRGCS